MNASRVARRRIERTLLSPQRLGWIGERLAYSSGVPNRSAVAVGRFLGISLWPFDMNAAQLFRSAGELYTSHCDGRVLKTGLSAIACTFSAVYSNAPARQQSWHGACIAIESIAFANRNPPLAERRLTKGKQNQLWASLYLTDIWPASR